MSSLMFVAMGHPGMGHLQPVAILDNDHMIIMSCVNDAY